eukprot:6462049-Amphidinium_carterae.1
MLAPFITPALVERVIGYWTHFMLFSRHTLCLFDEIYRWVRRFSGADRFKMTRLSSGARDELFGAVVVIDLLFTDLRAAVAPRLYLSDASQAKGAAVYADVDVKTAVLAWGARTCGSSRATALHAQANLYQVARGESLDESWEALVQSVPFKLGLVYRFKQADMHINAKELLAFRSALRHASRHVELERCRRGRSSSCFLNRILQSCLPLLLGTGISCRPVWTSTENNVADDPTRNRPLRQPLSRHVKHAQDLEEFNKGPCWPLAITKLVWAHRGFDATCGYLGEGPVLEQAHPSSCRDLRITVLPKTMERYLGRLRHLGAWLLSEGLPPWETVVLDEKVLNEVLCAYIQRLHNDSAPYSYAIE